MPGMQRRRGHSRGESGAGRSGSTGREKRRDTRREQAGTRRERRRVRCQATSGKTFPVFDPATEEEIAQVAWGEQEDADRAVRAARRAFDGPWRKQVTPSERGRMIWKLADLLEQHAEEFAQLEALDNGKPVTVARAADVPLAIDLLRYMAGWATKIEGRTIPISAIPIPGARFFAYTRHEPIGVVAQIIPWNFPLLMAAWKLGPALASGCTVILKPAEQTPLTALRPGELIPEVKSVVLALPS